MLSTTTSIFLFFVNKYYYLNINMYLKHDITSFHTYNFAIILDDLQITLKAKIFIVQQ